MYQYATQSLLFTSLVAKEPGEEAIYIYVPLIELLFSELLLIVPLKYWLLVFLKTGSVLFALPEKELSCLVCRGVGVD